MTPSSNSAAVRAKSALATLDPDGDADQEPIALSDGWNNPFAFAVLTDGTIRVADNAPDGSDLPVAERDGERIATTNPDGRLGVCGFLDNEMRSCALDEDGLLKRAGTAAISATRAQQSTAGRPEFVAGSANWPVPPTARA